MGIDIKIGQIIREELIEIQLQVIVSQHEELSVGVEAFARGIHPDTKEYINPELMFRLAREEQLSIDLDLLCVEKSFKIFRQIYEYDNESLLFININYDFIPYCTECGFLSACAAMNGIPTENIVIDISDFTMSDYDLIQQFITLHRSEGFYICIDDIGKDYSNIDKIILINPDMIKINHQLLEKLDYDNYRNNMAKYVVSIAHDMGVVVIAKGIECQDTLSVALRGGAQFAQGYYIGRPTPVTTDNIGEMMGNLLSHEDISVFIVNRKVESRRMIMTRLIQFIEGIKEEASLWRMETIEDDLRASFQGHEFVESGWLVDLEGIQMSSAYINRSALRSRNSSIFHVYKIGRSYQEKDVYRQLVDTTLESWITKPYVSLLSNENIVGTSAFVDVEGDFRCICCMNINYDLFEKYATRLVN